MRSRMEIAAGEPVETPSGLRLAMAVVLVFMVSSGIALVRIWPHQVAGVMGEIARKEHALGVAGLLLAACAQTLIALCGILPASVGAVAAGMTFGVLGGFLVCGSTTILGAVLAFLLARSLFRPFIARTLGRRPRAIRLDEAVARDGWRLVALMRVSPIMPFAMTSYAMGLTSIRLRQYLIGTLASLPALLGYVLMGHLAGVSLSSLSAGTAHPLQWALLVLATGATVLLTFRLARIGRLILRLETVPAMDHPMRHAETLVQGDR